ncbi:MAG: hypothetical protein MZV64_45330 [Ignavibacteriales bacterium]|nr:hypothetical protein [Ignavibacteriales bacterium]
MQSYQAKKYLEILKLAKISRLLISFLKIRFKDRIQTYERNQNSLFTDKLFEHHIEKVINEQGEVKENASQ